MYHSLQHLELAHDLARGRAKQAHSAPASTPRRSWILRLIAARPARINRHDSATPERDGADSLNPISRCVAIRSPAGAEPRRPSNGTGPAQLTG